MRFAPSLPTLFDLLLKLDPPTRGQSNETMFQLMASETRSPPPQVAYPVPNPDMAPNQRQLDPMERRSGGYIPT